MKDTLEVVLRELGMEGIQAFYIYLAVDYGSLFIFLGLCTWGVRSLWQWFKENEGG